MFGDKEKKRPRFMQIVKEDVTSFGEIRVLVDTSTGVQYLFPWPTVNANGITALLDANGKPLICEEYKRGKE